MLGIINKGSHLVNLKCSDGSRIYAYFLIYRTAYKVTLLTFRHHHHLPHYNFKMSNPNHKLSKQEQEQCNRLGKWIDSLDVFSRCLNIELLDGIPLTVLNESV